ncbi:MAG: PAS domain S-box protein [Bacteroidota bacterium]
MQENHYKHIIQKAPFAYAYHKIILDDSGKAVDFVFIEVNDAFEKMTGLKKEEIINKKVSEVIPGIKKESFDWISFYGDIALNKKEKEFEQFSEPLQKLYRVSTYSPKKHFFVTVFNDITENKQTKAKLIQSENKYKKLTEKTKIILWEFDIQKNEWLHVSPQSKTVLGYNPEEWTDMQFWIENLHPEDKNWALKYCVECTKKGENHKFEYRFKKKDGSYVWLLDDVSVEMKDNHPVKMWGSMIDITDRKIAEEELQKSEERYRLIFEYSPLGLFYFDKEGTIIACNKNFVKIIGSSYESLIGLNMLKFPDKKIVNALKDSLNGKTGLYEGDYKSVTANKTTALRILFPPHIKGSLLDGSVGIVEDVTERNKTEEARKKTEERFNLSMQATKDGLWDWDVVSDKSYFSPGYYTMLGYENQGFEATGKAWKKLVHPEDIENVINTNNACIKGECETFEVEFRMKTAHNEWKWILSRGKCVKRDKKGKALRIVGTHVDITERKHFIEKLYDSRLKLKEQNAEYRSMNQEYLAINEELNQVNEELRITLKDLAESNQRNKVLLENAFDGIYLLHGRKFEYVNKQFCKITGYSYEELTASDFNLFDALTDESKKIVKQRYNERKKGKNINDIYEFQIKTKSGAIKDLEVSTSALKSNGLPKVLGIIRDITKLKKAQKLEQEILIANQSAEFKQKFLANMSHEIRTPLTGMMGFIELLARTELNSTQLTYLNTLKQSGENLKEIINLILDYSKIESGEVTLKPVAFPASSIFDKVANLFSSICHKNVELNTSIDKAIPKYIILDQQRLNQILNNLVSNAVKFTEQGKISLSAKLEGKIITDKKSSKNDSVIVRIDVEDTGIGIPSESQKYLFKPFSQIESEGTTYMEGTGLGLSICKELSEILGGSISVKSTIGKGSTFSFTFKADIAKKGDIEKDDIIDSRSVVRIKPLNVLLVEDKKVNQMVVTIMLKSMGHEVDIANNGQEVLEIYKPDHYDLILMDIQMPVMDGVKATHELNKKYKNLPPIVGLSANAFEGDREKYMQQGMDEYLIKPIKSKDFENMLRKLEFI